ncbi:caspase family protein [Candidatus Sulfurimonas baltica]|nr:caspase family protein [Candidatus Sulfurimonas baltica]
MIKRVFILGLMVFVLSGYASGLKNPYNINQSEKFTALTNYLIGLELQPSKPTLPNKPKQPTIPLAKKLTKGKYEKTGTFEQRVKKEKAKRLKTIKTLEVNYAKDVRVYNDEVKKLTDNYNNELAKKQKKIDDITLKAMEKAYSIVYGKPYLENSLKYDADSETFFGVVTSTKGGFSEKVAVRVPIDQAESFEKNINSLKTSVVFDYKDNQLALKKIVVKKANTPYIAMLSDINFKSENISVAVGGGSLNLPASPLLSSSLAVSASDYSIGEVSYSKDPEIAKLQKQKFELEKNVRYKKQTLIKEAELRAQKLALESQIALLEQTKGGVNDIPSLLKKSKAKKVDNTKWLFIVGIENYEYTDPVAFSANSAKEFKSVIEKRLGIPESNIRTLINRGATSSKIDYNLKDMLRRVKSGDTVYFYYSGHGIPVPAQDNAPYMLAQDMNPAYIDDERFKLQNIYKKLSNSKATKIVAFIDSCFSGGTDNQALIKGVAATRIKPKSVTFNKNKMVVISAGSGTQYSNKYDEKSNRLFSYYLMRGLINNNTDINRLYDYVKSNVQEKSYEMGASYEQVPVYSGNIGLEL